MAEVKIYRVAYSYVDEDDARIDFSRWVQVNGMDEVLATLPIYLIGAPPSQVEAEPVILGWEEKILDTAPGEE